MFKLHILIGCLQNMAGPVVAEEISHHILRAVADTQSNGPQLVVLQLGGWEGTSQILTCKTFS